MSMQSEEASSSLAPVPQTWSEVWIKALTQPSVATYQDFVGRPEVSSRRAYIWVFLASMVSTGVTFLGSLVGLGAGGALDQGGGFLILILGSLCAAPLLGLFAILILIITAGISQAIAGALGGSGTYSELTYAIGAYTAPFGILSSVLGLIPFINLLIFPLIIYGVFLNILAIKSVNRFGWGKALASSVVIFALILIFVAVGVIVILALLGPAIGNVFSNIIQDIGTPIP